MYPTAIDKSNLSLNLAYGFRTITLTTIFFSAYTDELNNYQNL